MGEGIVGSTVVVTQIDKGKCTSQVVRVCMEDVNLTASPGLVALEYHCDPKDAPPRLETAKGWLATSHL